VDKGVWAEHLQIAGRDRTADIRQLGQDSRDKTAGTGLPGQVSRDRRVRTGKPEKTNWIVQPG
jgi:hypothetical protein